MQERYDEMGGWSVQHIITNFMWSKQNIKKQKKNIRIVRLSC